jgi:hypothetical protein
MKINKKNKFYLLLTAVVIVWGIIIFNIIDRLNDNDYEVIDDNFAEKLNIYKEINDEDDIENETELYTLSRDPFLLKEIKKPVKKAPSRKKLKKEIKKPSLKFNVQGIIVNANQKLVIIEDLTNNTTVFLGKGDKHESITVLEIKDDNIVKLKVETEIREIKIN